CPYASPQDVSFRFARKCWKCSLIGVTFAIVLGTAFAWRPKPTYTLSPFTQSNLYHLWPSSLSPQHEKFLFPQTIESSALIGHGGIRRGVVDVGEGARPAESATRGKAAAHYTGAGRRGIRHERALGAETAGALADVGRWWAAARATWAAVEP